MSGRDEGGRDFWSRRKAAVQKAEADELRELEALDVAEKRAELETKSDEEILSELELPDPDTLTDKDDFSRFLSAAVPERLRRRALRRLWGLNPVLANLDGLVDYADDYTDAATVVSNMQTVYQVGKGMFDKFADALEKEELRENTDADIKSGEVESSIDAVQQGKNVAPQERGGQNENSSMQLTDDTALVQNVNKREIPVDSEEVVLADFEEHRTVRRRMRFDYDA